MQDLLQKDILMLLNDNVASRDEYAKPKSEHIHSLTSSGGTAHSAAQYL